MRVQRYWRNAIRLCAERLGDQRDLAAFLASTGLVLLQAFVITTVSMPFVAAASILYY